MSAKQNLSFLFSLLLGISPLNVSAQIQEPSKTIEIPSEIPSLQQLDSLEINGESLKKGEDYNVAIQYANDYTKAYAGFFFKNENLEPVIIEHEIGAIDGFGDVEKEYYARNSINYAADLGWMSGKADGSFHPTDELTRGELVTILYRMASQPQEEVHEFLADLNPENPSYFTKAALWAVKHGIIRGYSDPDGFVRFKGEKAITRQELALMLYRYQGEEASDGNLLAFADGESVGAPYLDAMKWAIEQGIISGNQSEAGALISPLDNASRAQSATMLERFYKTRAKLSMAKAQESQSDEETKENPSVSYGWNEAGDEFISFESAKPVTGLLDLNGVLYYFNESGKLCKNQTIALNDQVYGTDEKGALKHGFELVQDIPCYYSLFDGHRQSGKKHYDGLDYRLNISQDEQGVIESVNGQSWCRFSDGSIARDEERSIDGESYYFDSNGFMVHEAFVHGFYFDKDGKKAISRAASFQNQNYYFGSDGAIVKGQAIPLENGESLYTDYRDGHLIDAREFKVEGEALALINQIGTNLYDLFIWASQINFTADIPHTLSLPEYGELAFETKTGNCYVYAAAFYYFAYLLGYDVLYFPGKAMSDVKNQIWSDHAWTGIYDETGKLYFYDPGLQYEFKGKPDFFKVDPEHSPINFGYDPAVLYKH